LIHQYLLLTSTTIHDFEYGEVVFESPNSVHAPNCGSRHEWAQYDKSLAVECEWLSNRLVQCARDFDECKQNKTLTQKRLEELNTPGMRQAVIEEALILRKELDKKEEEGVRDRLGTKKSNCFTC
jgi:hypothetical protein